MTPATRLPLWLALLGLLFTVLPPAKIATVHANPGPLGSTALYGAELGLLASAGTLLAPSPAQAPPPAEAASPEASAAPDEALAAAVDVPEPEPPAGPAAPPAPQPKGKVVCIDPGHGGKDVGAVHKNAAGQVDLTEAEVNLSIGLRLAEMLRQDGYEAHLTRTDGGTPAPRSKAADLQARADLANNAGADIFVSIHNNGHNNPALRGTEVYYCAHRPQASQSVRLARLVQDRLVRNLRQAGYDTIDRGVKDDAGLGHIGVLGPHLGRPTRMPGILGESLFVTNDADAAALQRADIREAIARGCFEGIKAYFGDAS